MPYQKAKVPFAFADEIENFFGVSLAPALKKELTDRLSVWRDEHCEIEVQDERELCAQISENMAIHGHNVQAPSCQEIAKKIRERDRSEKTIRKDGAAEDLTAKTEEELRAVVDAGEAAELELGRRYAEESRKVEARMNAGTDPFKAEELEFATESVCPCGAKLAYPKGIGPHGSWDCSAILMDTAPHKGQPGAVTHTDRKPFAFWKVK